MELNRINGIIKIIKNITQNFYFKSPSRSTTNLEIYITDCVVFDIYLNLVMAADKNTVFVCVFSV